jgi:hypothetical protein
MLPSLGSARLRWTSFANKEENPMRCRNVPSCVRKVFRCQPGAWVVEYGLKSENVVSSSDY